MKTRMRSDERRAAIVASAVHMFAEKGFRGTTTRELAASLGVTEPVLYQHFETKGELYAAIIEAKAAEGRERSAEFLEHVDGSDDRGFFTRLAELILGAYEDDPEFIRLLLYAALERHELAEMFYESTMVSFYDTVAGYIRRRTKDGAFRDVNPGLAARAFIGMVGDQGLSHVLFERDSRLGRKRLIDELVTVFLNGLVAGSGAAAV